MRFALREGVAAHDGARARVEIHLDQQRLREPTRLVRDDAPRKPAVFDVAQHFVAAGEQAGVLRELSAVEGQQPFPHRFVFRGRQHAERQPDERVAAVRDLAADFLVEQRRQVLLGAQGVQRVGEVVRRVEQRAVEIEQHAADRLAVGAAHRARRRCSR
jgi:hypothetical protein